MSDLDYIVRDLQRRLANMIRRGKVHSVDFSQTPPRVRVEYAAGAVTGWLPFVGSRQSVDSKSTWEPLAVGEGVMIFSESGELSMGVVMPSVPDATNVPPSISPNEHVTKYSDGTMVKYDRAAGKLTVDVVSDVELIAANKVSVQCGSADVNASAGVSVNAGGDVSVSAGGDVLADGSSIKLNGGAGVVTGACICPFTGSPHSDKSSTVFAGK
ncbi:phage baseplate assembly protein V [Marinomonas arenicola]|uniref:phage baseplate assembly protein V n=1 Tax=Marinomonas arenicola TaxID=569601 RepID=UPI00311D7861